MSGNSETDTGDNTGTNSNINRGKDPVILNQQVRRNDRDNRKQKMAVVDEEGEEDDNQTDSNDSIDALSMINSMMASSTISLPSESLKKFTNLDSFMESVTPVVPAQISELATLSGSALKPYFVLEDMWEALTEWSAYGVGVPLMLIGTYPTTQFYVPTLSGIQLYVNPPKPTKIGCSVEDKDGNNVSDRSFSPHNLMNLNRVSLRDKCLMSDKGTLVFEYMEHEQPHIRRTLTEKVSILASQFPELNNYRSSDLSPSSWICLAWYPIYRISTGPSLKDLEASFLTLHSLSTQPGSYSEPKFASTSSQEVRLPVIGVASYKLKGSMISPQGPECEQESDLLEAAADWINHVRAFIPDYQFFLNRYSR